MESINKRLRARQYTPEQVGLGLIVLTSLIYILAFLPLFRMISLSVIALAIIPVIIAAGAFGWWGGLIGGIAALLVNYILFSLINGNQPSFLIDPYFWVAHTVFIIVGVAVGYLQSILTAIRQEMHVRTVAETKLTYLSTHDPLTDLANQNLFYDRLTHAISRAERNSQGLAVLYLDIDSFKSINDSHGHDFGDQVLLVLADRLKNSVRASDTVARLGADEFAVILENITSDEDIAKVSQKIMATAAEEIRLQELSAQATLSCGISRYPKNGKSPNSLIRQADIAMTDAKKTGGNCFVFSSFSL
jgi:diguanylate cyclase (GGDEF)-like protein